MTPAVAPGVTEVPLGIDILQGDLFRRNPASRSLPAGRKPCFVNAFAGCGGLALGLVEAGWKGLLALEERRAAWDTLSTNLLHPQTFEWPEDIERRPWPLGVLLATRRGALSALAGSVDLLAAAIPCGAKASPEDPDNRIWHDFLTLAEILRPTLILLESTPAFARARGVRGRSGASFAVHFQESLPGYDVAAAVLDAGAFGVPQRRRRVWVAAARVDLGLPVRIAGFFDQLGRAAPLFLRDRGLPLSPTAQEAIGDLETGPDDRPQQDLADDSLPTYGGPRTAFQAAMHRNCGDGPADRHLTRHKLAVQARYRKLIDLVQRPREGRGGGKAERRPARVLLRSHPAPPVPASPETLLHYCEPRILSVREAARLQTFPDDFSFNGPRAASGARRNMVMPRYAQVGTATPPLLAEQVGEALCRLLRPCAGEQTQTDIARAAIHHWGPTETPGEERPARPA